MNCKCLTELILQADNNTSNRFILYATKYPDFLQQGRKSLLATTPRTVQSIAYWMLLKQRLITLLISN